FTTDTSSIIIPNNTNNEKTPIPEESVIQGYTSSPRVDTEIPKVSDEIDISKTNNNILQEISNITLYLAHMIIALRKKDYIQWF
ncbi:9025_t:CDS:2, partial [Racocetra persica]